MNIFQRMILWLFGVGEGDIRGTSGWAVEFTNPIAGWLVCMILIPAVAYFCWRMYRAEQGFLTALRRGTLLGLRLAAFAILLGILLQPVISMDVYTSVKGAVIVLVDDSKSLSIVDDQYTSDELEGLAKVSGIARTDVASKNRMELTKAWLTLADLKKFSPENEILMFRFSSKLEKLDTVAALSPEGTSTRIGDALLQAMKEARGKTINAIILVTDGRSNAGTTMAYVQKILEKREKPIPIYTIGVGSDRPPRDLRVARLSAEPVVLLNDEINFEFEIEHTGYEDRKVRIQLTDGKRTVDSKDVALKASGTKIKESFKLKADKAGDFEYTVQAEILPGETSRENNHQSTQVHVMDKQVRVLFVEGRPRSEYIFLKSSLIRDDKLHAYCYLTSADPNFKQEVSLELMRKGEPGLTRFPGDRTELGKFDVIIFGDVDIRTLGDPKRSTDVAQNWRTIADNLQWFVEELGGAIIFLGGHEYDPWQYRDTPLEKLLPVLVPSTNPIQNKIFKDPFKPKLTPHGRDEPILRLKPDADENQKYWESPDGLPPLFWYTPVREAKPGARVQMKHPDGSILMATMLIGRGRTMFFGTDETWRWREYTRDRTYYKLWGTAIQRMRVGKLGRNKRFTVFVRENYMTGERVEIEANVLDENMQPSKAELQDAEIINPLQQREAIKLTAIPGKPGYYAGVYEPQMEGQYKIRMGPSNKPEEWTLETFTVKNPILEFEVTSMDRPALEALSAGTGGVFYPLSRADQLLQDIKKGKALPPLKDPKERYLWDTPLVLFLFVLFLATEWALRKRWGLA